MDMNPNSANAARVLVTGGAGYIGAHCAVALLDAGYDVTLVDDLSRGHLSLVDGVRSITGVDVDFRRIDIRDVSGLTACLVETRPACVLHLAGLKVIAESQRDPVLYFDVNVGGTVALLSAMTAAGVSRLVFSSSASVYSAQAPLPVAEDALVAAQHPYAATKLAVEQMLSDIATADERWCFASLRYFNPLGAHPSAFIGEVPPADATNLMPSLLATVLGRRDHLTIYGRGCATPDGSPMRDFIHVMDLAEGHVSAVNYVVSSAGGTHQVFNLGTGRGTTVLALVAAMARVHGAPVPVVIEAPRPGDLPVSCACVHRATNVLRWRAARDVTTMCADALRWERRRLMVPAP